MRAAHNIVVHGMPSTIAVDGVSYDINTCFRIGININRVLDDIELAEEEITCAIFSLSFSGVNPVPPHTKETWDAVMEFHLANQFALWDTQKAKRSATNSFERSFCWDYDIDLVIADFKREYNIDLCNPETKLHWHYFMALFRGLSEGARTNQIRATRLMKIPEKASPEQRSSLENIKAAAALMPRSEDEHRQLERQRAHE